MGFRTGYVITSLGFLSGVLFVASIYDFPLIYYTPFDPQSAIAAENFYLSVYSGPRALTALLHGMMGLGLVGLLAKLHRWSELAKYFDGTCIAFMTAAISMYAVVIVPNLRLLSEPGNVDLLNRSSIRTERDAIIKAQGGEPPNLYTEPLSADERISALRIIAATNTINLLLLIGVAVLQATEVWYEEGEKKQAEKARTQAADELRQQLKGKDVSEESKKSQ